MKVFKYCKKKYHIQNSDFIQIGTLNYYRNSDNNYISDINEGHVKGIELVAGKKALKLNSDQTSFWTNGYINSPYFQEDKITIQPHAKSKLTFPKKFPNHYVFCCSGEKTNANKLTMNEFDYDSSYEIKYIQDFSDLVGNLILEHLEQKLNIKNLSGIAVIHKSISYLKNEWASFSYVPNTDDIMHFKSDQFSSQKEYRFVWAPVDNDKKFFDIPDKTLLIPLTDKLKNCFKF